MARRITLALERYDRHLPFHLGQLDVPKEYDLVPLDVGMAPGRRDGEDRHGRMLKGNEFDAAETSLASYLIARSRNMPFTAIPVFPRRLFSQNHYFVAEKAPYRTPADLKGKRVIFWAFQVTMSVLAKGDWKRNYDLDWRDVEILTLRPEELTFPGLSITQLPANTDPLEMLRSGKADMYVDPHPPAAALSGRDGIRRLFSDTPSECRRYFKKYGYYPIMHLMALRNDTVQAAPDLPRTLMRLWEEARLIAEDCYHDPGYALSAFAEQEFHRQKRDMAENIWPSGLKNNRMNLEHFMENMLDQGLLKEPIPIDDLFHPSVRDS
jgi:4,5-dihydroxyphthalate decarboxylase